VVFSPDGKTVISTGTDRSIAVRDAATLKLIKKRDNVHAYRPDGSGKVSSTPSPTSPFTSHPSPLTPHPSPLTPHPSSLTLPSPLTPHPSPLTPHFPHPR
jgi:hypothetical protein